MPSALVDLRGLLPTAEGKAYKTRSLDDIKYIVIHHSGVDVESSTYRFPYATANYHVNVKGWPGIGYHRLIDKEGIIYMVNDLETMSYHVSGRNHECLGICLEGDFTNHPPNTKQINALKRLIGDPQQMPQHHNIIVVGHREIALPHSPTACPGDTWVQWGGKL